VDIEPLVLKVVGVSGWGRVGTRPSCMQSDGGIAADRPSSCRSSCPGRQPVRIRCPGRLPGG